MRNLLSKIRSSNPSDDQKDLWLGLWIILAVALIYYFQWAYYLTGLPFSKVNIDYPQRYFWWANDSRDYKAAGEWLFGRSTFDKFGQLKSDTGEISSRPWLYPLLLGSSRTLFGGGAERVLWISQLLMWLGSGVLIFFALHNLTRSKLLALLGAGLFYSHPSPLLLTFHGLTETLNILLIAAFCWVLTAPSRNRLYYALLLIALATVTKPVYLFFLILLAGYVFVQSRQTPRLKQAGLVALLLLPIWIQLLLSFIAIGRPTLSTNGSFTFKNYLVADVYLRAEGTTWREAMAQIKDWDIQQQIDYLWSHQKTSALAVRSHLIDSNLLTGSQFAQGDGNVMKPFSIVMNDVAAYIHLLILPLVLYYLLSNRYKDHKEIVALLYVCFVLQWLTSAITSGQEDRMLITALPLWIIAYLIVLMGMGKAALAQPVATQREEKRKPRQKNRRT